MGKLTNGIKELLLLLLIFLIIGGFCYIRYALYKNRKEELQKYSAQLTSQSAEEINATNSTLKTRVKNFAGNVIHVDRTSDNNKVAAKSDDDDTNTLIHFDVSSEYNSFIFDDTLFMFEGDQTGKTVKNVLDRMIETASDDFFSNPKLTVRNFGGLDGTIEDGDAYVSNITAVRNNVNDGDSYNISFGYNKLKTYANEVIIEKK